MFLIHPSLILQNIFKNTVLVNKKVKVYQAHTKKIISPFPQVLLVFCYFIVSFETVEIARIYSLMYVMAALLEAILL